MLKTKKDESRNIFDMANSVGDYSPRSSLQTEAGLSVSCLISHGVFGQTLMKKNVIIEQASRPPKLFGIITEENFSEVDQLRKKYNNLLNSIDGFLIEDNDDKAKEYYCMALVLLIESPVIFETQEFRNEQISKLYFGLGQILKRANLLSKAEYNFKMAVVFNLNNHFVYNSLGLLSESENYTENAKRYYRKALEIDKTHDSALINLGNLLATEARNTGNEAVFKEACALLDAACKSAPNNATAFATAAYVKSSCGLLDEACKLVLKVYLL